MIIQNDNNNKKQNKLKTKNKYSLKGWIEVAFQFFIQKYYTWQNNTFDAAC